MAAPATNRIARDSGSLGSMVEGPLNSQGVQKLSFLTVTSVTHNESYRSVSNQLAAIRRTKVSASLFVIGFGVLRRIVSRVPCPVTVQLLSTLRGRGLAVSVFVPTECY